MNATKRIEAVGHVSLAIMELKSSLEQVEDVVPAVTRDASIVELIAPATTDAAAAFVYLRAALACANADEDTAYDMAGETTDPCDLAEVKTGEVWGCATHGVTWLAERVPTMCPYAWGREDGVGLPETDGMSAAEGEEIARLLWVLLDNIDTLDDSCKDDDHAFREQTRRQQKERWRVSESDGQTVRFHAKIHPPLQPSEPDVCPKCGLPFCSGHTEEDPDAGPASPV